MLLGVTQYTKKTFLRNSNGILSSTKLWLNQERPKKIFTILQGNALTFTAGAGHKHCLIGFIFSSSYDDSRMLWNGS